MLVLLLNLFLHQVSPCPAAIYGDDDRVAADLVNSPNPGPSLGPATSIGKLEVRLRGPSNTFSCTASLIGPDLILTNAHCISDLDVRMSRLRLSSQQIITFFPLYHRGPHTRAGVPLPGNFWQSRVVAIDAAPQEWDINANYNRWVESYNRSLALSPPPPRNSSLSPQELARRSEAMRLDSLNDWVILRLEEPLGLYLGWLPISIQSAQETLRSRTRLSLAGYSGDFRDGGSQVLSVHSGCQFLGISPEGVVSHDCDSSPGASGAPIYALIHHSANRTSGELHALLNQDIMGCLNSTFREGCDPTHNTLNLAIPASVFYEPASRALARSLTRHSQLPH
jgi:hypothetical protein